MNKTENRWSGKTMCLQLSVDAVRWPDEMLEGGILRDGKPLDATQAREALRSLKAQGFEVVPCGHHVCDEKGRCQGEPTRP